MEPSKQHDKELMLSMIGVPWDKRMGKSVRRLVPEGPHWQPPASAPVATEAEEAAGQPGQAEGAPVERAEGAPPERAEGVPQNVEALITPRSPRTKATPIISKQLEDLPGPERKRMKEGEGSRP
eukprot:4070196-Heterocapsa_arctica.AAC.1